MFFFSFSERHKELLNPLSGLRRLRSFPTQNRCICEHSVVTMHFTHIGIYVTRIFTREKGGRGIRPTTCATVMIRFLWDRVTWWYYNRNRDTHCSQSADRVSRQPCHSTLVKMNSRWIDSFSPCFFGKPKALKDALNQSARRFCSTRFTWQSSECRWTFVWGEYRSVTWYKHCLALMKDTRGAWCDRLVCWRL